MSGFVRTILWADRATERTRDELLRVVSAAKHRVAPRKRSKAPQQRLAWPERQLPPDGAAEDYQAAREKGARAFTLWRDPESSREAFAHVVTLSASPKQGAEYEIRGADDERLAVIRREPASFWRLRRARWSVRQLDQDERRLAAARKGRIVWWCVWLPFWPVQYLLHLVSFGDYDEVFEPRRLRFRSAGRVVLDYRGNHEDLEVLADWWDPRVTTALLVLIHTWDSDSGAKSDHPSFA